MNEIATKFTYNGGERIPSKIIDVLLQKEAAGQRTKDPMSLKPLFSEFLTMSRVLPEGREWNPCICPLKVLSGLQRSVWLPFYYIL